MNIFRNKIQNIFIVVKHDFSMLLNDFKVK